jgi:two-component SAPR family response regulator
VLDESELEHPTIDTAKIALKVYKNDFIFFREFMMARNIHKFYFEISFLGNVCTRAQKNTNPRVGIEIIGGPTRT